MELMNQRLLVKTVRRAVAAIAIASVGAGTLAADDDQTARLEQLEREVAELKVQTNQSSTSLDRAAATNSNRFNPAVSVVLDGRFSRYQNHADDYELPGFSLGGEAGLDEEGFNVGHTEIIMSANVDDLFMGFLTFALADHEGEIEVELEEAYVETLGLGGGFTIRGGRFFSAVGYHNQKHAHAWDFADAPLIYEGLWGSAYYDDGVRLSWIAPTDLFIEVGTEALAGGQFPAGDEKAEVVGANTGFVNVGGDIGESLSWQVGASYFEADTDETGGRSGGGHDHGGGGDEVPTFFGESETVGVSAIVKWAPSGNFKNQYIALQSEYFEREEEGRVDMVGSSPLETTTLDGDQKGYYVQAVYQFRPQWRVGARFDRVWSDNRGDDSDVIEEAGLSDEDHDPKRISGMVEYNHSEFSRIRLQYNHDDSYESSDSQWILQYTMSLGSHGAHSY